MTPDKWRDVERIYVAALERDAGERATFLEAACGADKELRREVESLLEYQPRAEDFLEGARNGGNRRWGASLREAPGTQAASAARQLVGRVFGSYEVKTLIAAGGMGEVYRALDTRLHRIVALKVLPEHLSDHPERRERFKREALLISRLNHPHICALYHVGTEDGLDYLVMEHIDGETLQDRLKRGTIKWAQALEYLTQIADALDAAHSQSIVHRDLKPANVMLTKSGVKVLDFSLAARPFGPNPSPLDASLDASRGLTGAGRIMGTVPYMAPEQLAGTPADARTDIFAFGALAYEMVTGAPPFEATSHAGLLGAMKEEPEPIVRVIPDIPPLLARTLARCLSRDPDGRWQTASDLLFQLRSIQALAGTVSPDPTPRALSIRTERALWASAIVICLIAAGLVWRRGDDASAGRATGEGVIRFPLLPAETTSFTSSFDVPFALSPDGRQIAYVAVRPDGTRQLWIRALDSEQSHLLAGTDGADSPFWSPDSQWVGFVAAGSLKKVRVTSPIVQVIASPVWTMSGAAWNRHDVIVFPGEGGLHRVSANGGVVSRITNDTNFRLWPQFLSDGDHYIYASFSPRDLRISSLANESPRTLMAFPVNVSSLAYVPGFVLFVQDGVLYARPFDERRRDFTGAAIRVLDGIPVNGPGRAPFSVSPAGVLAFWTEPVGTAALLRWVARDGRAASAIDVPAKYFGFALSPDGRDLAFSRVGRNGGPDVWVRSLDTGTERQLTFDGLAFAPRWSPDGSRIVFAGIGERPPPMLLVKHATLPSAAVPLGRVPHPQFAATWARNFILSVAVDLGGATGDDLWMQREDGTQRTRLPVNSEFNESEGSLSPDTRWIAYTTDRTGRNEVWVASLPSGQPRRQVSTGGGTSPQWCDGQGRIVYLSEDRHLLAAPFQGGADRIELGAPERLFRLDDLIHFDRRLVPTANYYVAAADCQRFLMATRAPDPQTAPISIVVNWPALMAR